MSEEDASDGSILLDVAGISVRCNVPERMARRIISQRRVPVVKVGRYARVRLADLEAFLSANTRPAVGE
jgi:hypothetical protein